MTISPLQRPRVQTSRAEELIRTLQGRQSGSDQEIVKAVLDRLKYADYFRSLHIQRVWRWRRLYHQRNINRRAGSNLPTSALFEDVETLTSQVSASLAGDPSFFFDTENPFRIDQVEAVSRFFNHQLRRAGFEEKKTPWVRESVLTGIGVLKYGLELETYSDNSKSWKPHLSNLILEDVWLDPQAIGSVEPGFMIHQTFVRESRLRELERAGIYKNVKMLQNLRETAELDSHLFTGFSGTEDRARLPSEMHYADPYARIDPMDPLVPVLEYYGTVATRRENGDLEVRKNRLVTIALGGILLREDGNPFGVLPFAVARLLPNVSHAYGLGLGEIRTPSARAEAAIRNMQLDLLAQKLQPMYAAGDSVQIGQNRLLYSPGKVVNIEGGPRAEFDTLPSPDVPQESLILEDIIRRQGQSASGLTDLARGEAQNPRKTRGEVEFLARSTGVRFRTYLESFVRPIKAMMQNLLLAYSDLPNREIEAAKVQGSDGLQTARIQKEQLSTLSQLIEVKVDPDRANPEARIQKILGLMNLLQGFPELRSIINLRRTAEVLREALDFHHQDPILHTVGEFQEVAFKTVAPEEEHRRLLEGMTIQVLPGDVDENHLPSHIAAYQSSPALREGLRPHILEHLEQMVQKKTAQNRGIRQGILEQIPEGIPGGLGALGGGGGA